MGSRESGKNIKIITNLLTNTGYGWALILLMDGLSLLQRCNSVLFTRKLIFFDQPTNRPTESSIYLYMWACVGG